MRNAFVTTVALLPGVASFALAPRSFPRALTVAQNAPQYDKVDGVLTEAEVVARGSVMLHCAGENDYKPGHVLALEIEGDDDNAEWLRGPYTVSRATPESFDVLIKVVGKKTEKFAAASGAPIRFGGKFHVPIVEGIRHEEGVKRVVMISTGTGVGPLVGAVEEALLIPGFPPIDILACFRSRDEVCFGPHLDALAAAHPGRLKWRAVVSSEAGGRLSGSAANLDHLTAAIAGFKKCGGGIDTHFHLIGNGAMVGEFQAGLAQGGVPEARVTVEMYFNHKAQPDPSAVDAIAKTVIDALAKASKKAAGVAAIA